MALVSILLPAFFFEDENDIMKQVCQQLGMKNDQFQLTSIQSMYQAGAEVDHRFKEYGIKLVNSDLSLRRIEGILEEQYITQKKVEKCKEALTTLSQEFNNLVQSPNIKDLDSQLQKRTKKLKQVKEDNRKLRQLLKAQLENSEKIRVETQTTVETLREEFDLLVRELSNIQKKDIDVLPNGNQQAQSQQNYIQVQPLNNSKSNQQTYPYQQQQQQQHQFEQQSSMNGINNGNQIQNGQYQNQSKKQQIGGQTTQTQQNTQLGQNFKIQQGQQQLNDNNTTNTKGNPYSNNSGGQQSYSSQNSAINQQTIPIQKGYQQQNSQLQNQAGNNNANNTNVRNIQIGSFGSSGINNNNSNNNSVSHNSNNNNNNNINQITPLQLKNINNNNNMS